MVLAVTASQKAYFNLTENISIKGSKMNGKVTEEKQQWKKFYQRSNKKVWAFWFLE